LERVIYVRNDGQEICSEGSASRHDLKDGAENLSEGQEILLSWLDCGTFCDAVETSVF
jgi:hypothetical protein